MVVGGPRGTGPPRQPLDTNYLCVSAYGRLRLTAEGEAEWRKGGGTGGGSVEESEQERVATNVTGR